MSQGHPHLKGRVTSWSVGLSALLLMVTVLGGAAWLVALLGVGAILAMALVMTRIQARAVQGAAGIDQAAWAFVGEQRQATYADLLRVEKMTTDAVATLLERFADLAAQAENQLQLVQTLLAAMPAWAKSSVVGIPERQQDDSKVQLDALARQLVESANALEHGCRALTVDVDDAIRCLQFPDMTGQLLAHVLRRLLCIEEALQLAWPGGQPDHLARLQALRERVAHSPVLQSAMGSGSVDLF